MMEYTQLESVLESLLFASGDQLGVPQMADITGEPDQEIVRALEALCARYEAERRGIELVRLAVSYTHLDVYKRQPFSVCGLLLWIVVSQSDAR